MLETLEKLVTRIEEVEDRMPRGTTNFDERLTALAADVDGVRTGTGETVRHLERAIARLSERLSRLEARMGPAGDDGRAFGANRDA